MKITASQLVLAGFVSLLAIFWMRTVLLYALLICIILISSWLLGLLMYLQLSLVSHPVDGLSSPVHDNKQSLLHSTLVRLDSILPLIYLL